MTQSDAPHTNGVQVIARVAGLLRLLGAEPEGLTSAELATRSGLPRTTVHRLIHALTAEGFVHALPSGELRIGTALVGIAVGSRRDLRHEVAPYLERLSHELGETVDLAVLDAGEVLFIAQVPSQRALRVVSEVGTRFPVHCTASGKALLAGLAAGEAAALLPSHLERLTKHTITSRRRLLEELQLVRSSGLAYDREEQSLGVAAVGTLVKDEVGLAAAITVVLPAARLPESQERIDAALLEVRADVLRALGGA